MDKLEPVFGCMKPCAVCRRHALKMQRAMESMEWKRRQRQTTHGLTQPEILSSNEISNLTIRDEENGFCFQAYKRPNLTIFGEVLQKKLFFSFAFKKFKNYFFQFLFCLSTENVLLIKLKKAI